MPNTKNKSMLTNRQYDILKHVVQIVLPAAASLYFGLAEIWGLPHAAEVVGTTALFTTFLGVVLKISNKTYNDSDAKYDGTLVIDTTNPDTDLYSLEVDSSIDELDKKDQLVVRVSHQ